MALERYFLVFERDQQTGEVKDVLIVLEDHPTVKVGRVAQVLASFDADPEDLPQGLDVLMLIGAASSPELTPQHMAEVEKRFPNFRKIDRTH